MVALVKVQLGEDGGSVQVIDDIIDCWHDVTFSQDCFVGTPHVNT